MSSLYWNGSYFTQFLLKLVHIFYIEDTKNKISNVYNTLEIKEDTTLNLTFSLSNSQPIGKYRIVSDGKEISSGNVQ